MIKRILLAAAALPLIATAANATASVAVSKRVMCAPGSPSASKGPRHIVNPSTGGGTYNLDQNGCALMVQADWQYFAAQGFTVGSGTGVIFAGPFTAQTTASNSPVLPANAMITGIVIQETAGHSLTGGLDVGIAGSSDQTIVAAFAVAANAVTAVPPGDILAAAFPVSGSTAGPTQEQIYFNAHSSWNSGSIYVTIFYQYF